MSRKKTNKGTKPTINGRVKDSIRLGRASDIITEQLGKLNLLSDSLCPDKELEEMSLFERNIAYMAETAHTEMVALMLRLKVLAGFCGMREEGELPLEDTLPPDPFDEENPDPLEWIIENRTVWEDYDEGFPIESLEGETKITKDGKIIFEPKDD